MKMPTGDQWFTYGGRSSEEYGAFLTAYSVPPTPGTIDNELVIPGRDGTYDAGTDLTRLDLTLQMGLWVADSGRAAINDAIRRLIALLDPRNDYQQLIFGEDPDYYLLAKLTSSSGTSQVNPQPVGRNGEMAAIVDLAMKCKDPHWYSTLYPEVTVPAGVIDNAGTAPSPVVITVTANAASAAGVHKGVVIDGQEVSYAGAMNLGDVIVVDTDLWTMLLNGANAIGGWFGEMPQLPGGESTVDVVGPCTATITYTPRWLA